MINFDTFLFRSLVQRKDADVVIHGDIWANNYLFSRSDDSDCFMVDWQFTSTGNIVKKYINILYSKSVDCFNPVFNAHLTYERMHWDW